LGGNEPGALAAIDAIKEEVRKAIDDIRRVVHELRPTGLDELGLVGVVEHRIETFARAPQAPTFSLHAPDDLGPLPAAVEVAAVRVLSEAMTNVVNHANASRCDIRIAQNGNLSLEIRDDGEGTSSAAGTGSGLRSIRSRVDELGGTFLFQSTPGVGTCLEVQLPINGS
jgi:two-component system NarL family sensor kinase